MDIVETTDSLSVKHQISQHIGDVTDLSKFNLYQNGIYDMINESGRKKFSKKERQKFLRHINYLKQNLEKQEIYNEKFSEILKNMDIFDSENDENSEKQIEIIIMLDQVTDPQNIGSIMRSCALFNCNILIVGKDGAENITKFPFGPDSNVIKN